jgi:hypothetical protein
MKEFHIDTTIRNCDSLKRQIFKKAQMAIILLILLLFSYIQISALNYFLSVDMDYRLWFIFHVFNFVIFCCNTELSFFRKSSNEIKLDLDVSDGYSC